MKIYLTIFSLIFLFFGAELYSADQSTEKQVTGYGASYEDALSNALVTAVRQVRGMEIGTMQSLKVDYQQLAEKALQTISINESTNIYDKTRGWIKTFSIVEVKKPEKNELWSIVIKAEIPLPPEARSSAKTTIAILPMRLPSEGVAIQNDNLSAKESVARLSDTLAVNLTNSGKFTVVDRKYLRELGREIKLLESGNAPPMEAARIGQMLGADILVTGQIYRFRSETERRQYYAGNFDKRADILDFQLSLIDTSLGTVVGAVNKTLEYVRAKDETTVEKLYQHFANELSSTIIEAVFPVLLIDYSDLEQIILNQGSARLVVGDLLQVHAQGKEIKDPQTQQLIQVKGQMLAKIQVTLVDKYYSTAKLVDGNLAQAGINPVATPLIKNEAAGSQDSSTTPGSSDKPIKWQ